MHRRDWIAAAVGLILGLTPATSSAMTGSELARVVLGCSVAAPLIVSLIARRRVMLLAFLPNLVMAITVALRQRSMAGTTPSAGEFLSGLLNSAAFLAGPAFVVASIVKLVRHLRGSLEEHEAPP